MAYKRLKTIENHETFRPTKWSRSLTGGGHLPEVPTVRLWLGKFWCLDEWSLMGGGHTWRFNCIIRKIIAGKFHQPSYCILFCYKQRWPPLKVFVVFAHWLKFRALWRPYQSWLLSLDKKQLMLLLLVLQVCVISYFFPKKSGEGVFIDRNCMESALVFLLLWGVVLSICLVWDVV